jgi:hypothetical protein
MAIRTLAADPQRREGLGFQARETALGSLRHDVILGAFERELESRLPRSVTAQTRGARLT